MIHSFTPFVHSTSKILILGPMPGITSLEKQEYYAHPRNHFWKIIYTLFDCLPISTHFEEKIKVLQNNNIGLWDVLQHCERKGSLDMHIKNHQENDFETLFITFPLINKIVFNGKESHKFFLKKFGHIKGITYYVMPSTSPANTMSFEKKLQQWSVFLE